MADVRRVSWSARPTGRVCAALAAGGLLAVAAAAPALAHVSTKVNGYQFVIGWQHEPAYTGVQNAVQIVIHDPGGNPVDDLGTPPSLRVTVSTSSLTSNPLDLEPSFDPDTGFGTHGEFDAPIIPTAPGTYTFHVTGTLGGQPVDKAFTSSDSTFNNVVDPSAVQFPVKLQNAADLATNVSRLNPRVENALTASRQAHDKASSAETLAIVALAVGAVLGVTGIIIGVTGRRQRP